MNPLVRRLIQAKLDAYNNLQLHTEMGILITRHSLSRRLANGKTLLEALVERNKTLIHGDKHI